MGQSDSHYDIAERKKYLLLNEQDSNQMKEVKTVVEPHLQTVLDSLYKHFLSYNETKKFFQSQKHLENVKTAQGKYFRELIEGNYDDGYQERRLIIGRTHERIGLEPTWYLGAYARYMCLLVPIMVNNFQASPQKLSEAMQSLIKVIFLDMGYAIDTYIEAMQLREENLKQTFINALNEFSNDLSATTSQIVTSLTEQSTTATQQAASISEVTTTISELKQTSLQALDNAQKVIEVSQGTQEASEAGKVGVEKAIGSMQEIQKQVETVAEKILNLSEQTQQIGEIIQTVNEIAGQSKVLALNASIEAARAAEHGRGFSVVASEIRSLADQSKEATTQVRSILGEIQKATNSAVMATEEGSKKVDVGAELAQNAGTTINDLALAIDGSAEAARIISASARQQTKGIEQVAGAMVDIDKAISENANGLKDTEKASQRLSDMSESMQKLIIKFSGKEDKKIEWKYK